MGTKNNPGAFDCYAHAKPDEPMFVLLARDKHAPALVWLWAVLRELEGEDPAKVKEARECCLAMMKYAKDNNRKVVGVGQSALAAVLEIIRAANYSAANAPNTATTDDQARMFFAGLHFEDNKAPA